MELIKRTGLLILFVLLGVFSRTGDAQEPREGLVIYGLDSKKPASIKCYCYSKADGPPLIGEGNYTNGQYKTCEIVSRKSSTVELLVRSLPGSEVIFSSQDCLIKKRDGSAAEMWTDPIATFGKSTKSRCLLITDLDVVWNRTTAIGTISYWFILVILVLGIAYAVRRYDFYRRMQARWQSYRYRDDTQEYVTFQR